MTTPDAQRMAALEASWQELREALKYARRFLNVHDHDVAFIDTALRNARTVYHEPSQGESEG